MASVSLAHERMNNLLLAFRSLRRAPAFSASAVLVLAIGVGGSTAVFSVLRSVVLRPLALPSPDRLMRLYERPAGLDARWAFSGPEFQDLAKENGAFESVAGIRAVRQTMTGHGSPVQLRVARITASFFSTLQTWPAVGRGPSAEEDIAGGPLTAVLTDAFWRREFGADPAAVGRTIVLDGRTYSIGGVMPAGFSFPLLRQSEVLIPLAMGKFEREFRGTNWLTVVGRVKTGGGVRQAQADLDVLAPRIFARIDEHSGWRMEAQPLLDDLVGPLKPALTVLLAAVLLALLIACANVASLLLARGFARQRELAIRAALGGGRAHLVNHLLMEALLIAAIGGGLGLLLAPWALSALLLLAPPDLPRFDEIRLDGVVLGFALAASTIAGLLAGLVPALQVTQPSHAEDCRAASHADGQHQDGARLRPRGGRGPDDPHALGSSRRAERTRRARARAGGRCRPAAGPVSRGPHRRLRAAADDGRRFRARRAERSADDQRSSRSPSARGVRILDAGRDLSSGAVAQDRDPLVDARLSDDDGHSSSARTRPALDRREDFAARAAGERGVREALHPHRRPARASAERVGRAAVRSVGDRGSDRRRAHQRSRPRAGARGGAAAAPVSGAVAARGRARGRR